MKNDNITPTRTVLVTGASRGIGRGIALALSEAGFLVAIHYNGNREAALQTAAECRDLRLAHTGRDADNERFARSPENDVFQADISKLDHRDRLVEDVFSSFGDLGALVNNAGIAPRKRDDILVAEESVFNEVLNVNLRGPYFLTQAVARRWVNSGQRPRRIVFVTSVSARSVSVARGEYCVSKAALSMAASVFAARLAGDGIPVFEVRPGIIKTDMTAGVADKYDSLIPNGLVPQKRWGEPHDIGTAVRSMVDGSLDFCAGTVIDADGGLHIPRL